MSTYIERDVRDIGELRHVDRFIHLMNILAPRSATLLNKAAFTNCSSLFQGCIGLSFKKDTKVEKRR